MGAGLLLCAGALVVTLANIHHVAALGLSDVTPTPCLNVTEIDNLDTLTQEQFTALLTDPCRYDRLIKPETEQPLPVQVQIVFSHMESSDQVQFKAHMTVQYSYNDHRLNYATLSPKRQMILGEDPLKNRIWIPHLIIKNIKDTAVMGFGSEDVFISITPNGDVVYSFRMIATFYCWMDLKKFPFDSQECNLTWSSWTYSVKDLVLQWSNDSIQVSKTLHLTEFILSNVTTSESTSLGFFNNGPLQGEFSKLSVTFRLYREVGYYMMDYFLPSILLVCTSWVTFWLQADAGPPRATLGTSTMLAFITLNGGLIKNLPKVSYIKASDVWFLACSVFIFGSLAEFAFVNVIWRRKKKVELMKHNSTQILRAAITPSGVRKDLRKAESMRILCEAKQCMGENLPQHYLTVHEFPVISGAIIDMPDESLRSEPSSTSISEVPPEHNWHTMTPQEVAIWIDKKSRIVFPVAFIIFNIFYWSFVYIF